MWSKRRVLTLVCLLGRGSLQTPCVGIEEEEDEHKLTCRELKKKENTVVLLPTFNFCPVFLF